MTCVHLPILIASRLHAFNPTFVPVPVQQVYSSMDAGHYLCDFIFYCSLAEAKRGIAPQEKFKERSTPPKPTPVLFMHCPPVDQPLSTEQVTDAIQRIVLWVCGRLHHP